jgi:hypothetical protein
VRSHGEQDGILFARIAAKAGLLDVKQSALFLASMSGRFVKGRSIAGLHRKGARGAHTQAKTRTIAQLVTDNARFAIHHLDRPLGAGGYTQATTITQFLVDADDGPYYRVHAHASML